jgi:hypothetical protein
MKTYLWTPTRHSSREPAKAKRPSKPTHKRTVK